MHLSTWVGASRLGAALVAALFAVTTASGASLEVAPTKLVVDAKGASTLTLANRGATPIIVQIEGFAWEQVNGEDVLKPSTDVLVSPPMARIAPGGKQTVRVMVKPGTAAQGKERTYRILASELPDPVNNEERTIRVLLQFNIPVFAGSPATAVPQVAWDASAGPQGLALSARNNGAAHVKFTKLELVTPSGKRVPVKSKGVPYVLAGATRAWTIGGAFGAGEQVTVEARVSDNDAVMRQTVVVRR
jgi:fimbrial chaperone protein